MSSSIHGSDNKPWVDPNFLKEASNFADYEKQHPTMALFKRIIFQTVAYEDKTVLIDWSTRKKAVKFLSEHGIKVGTFERVRPLIQNYLKQKPHHQVSMPPRSSTGAAEAGSGLAKTPTQIKNDRDSEQKVSPKPQTPPAAPSTPKAIPRREDQDEIVATREELSATLSMATPKRVADAVAETFSVEKDGNVHVTREQVLDALKPHEDTIKATNPEYQQAAVELKKQVHELNQEVPGPRLKRLKEGIPKAPRHQKGATEPEASKNTAKPSYKEAALTKDRPVLEATAILDEAARRLAAFKPKDPVQAEVAARFDESVAALQQRAAAIENAFVGLDAATSFIENLAEGEVTSRGEAEQMSTFANLRKNAAIERVNNVVKEHKIDKTQFAEGLKNLEDVHKQVTTKLRKEIIQEAKVSRAILPKLEARVDRLQEEYQTRSDKLQDADPQGLIDFVRDLKQEVVELRTQLKRHGGEGKLEELERSANELLKNMASRLQLASRNLSQDLIAAAGNVQSNDADSLIRQLDSLLTNINKQDNFDAALKKCEDFIKRLQDIMTPGEKLLARFTTERKEAEKANERSLVGRGGDAKNVRAAMHSALRELMDTPDIWDALVNSQWFGLSEDRSKQGALMRLVLDERTDLDSVHNNAKEAIKLIKEAVKGHRAPESLQRALKQLEDNAKLMAQNIEEYVKNAGSPEVRNELKEFLRAFMDQKEFKELGSYIRQKGIDQARLQAIMQKLDSDEEMTYQELVSLFKGTPLNDDKPEAGRKEDGIRPLVLKAMQRAGYKSQADWPASVRDGYERVGNMVGAMITREGSGSK